MVVEAVAITQSSWKTVRTIDPGAGTTFSDDTWLADQDAAAATASVLANVQPALPGYGNLGQLGIMITLLDADGKVDAADQIATLVATIGIDEVVQAAGREPRVLGIEVLTDLATAGLQIIARTTEPIHVGQFAIRLSTITVMPAGVKTLVVQARVL